MVHAFQLAAEQLLRRRKETRGSWLFCFCAAIWAGFADEKVDFEEWLRTLGRFVEKCFMDSERDLNEPKLGNKRIDDLGECLDNLFDRESFNPFTLDVAYTRLINELYFICSLAYSFLLGT